jgi:DNA-binding transcriptional LysR family regulator
MGNLPEMAVFAKVVEAKSFSAAARSLDLSKSAVSKQVTKLEQALGARLLNRTTRHLSLTEIGAAVYEHCARMVAESEEAVLAAGRLSLEPTGTIKLSTSVAFGKMHMAPAISEFLRKYPKVSVQLVLTDHMVDLADEGFDLVIRLTDKPGPNLVVRKIAPLHYAVCGSPAYFKQAGLPRTPQDLTHHNCLFYAYQSIQDRWSFKGSDGPISVRIRGNFQVNSSEAIREALLAGMGVGLVPTFTVGQDLKSGALQAVLTKYRPLGGFGSSIYAAYLPNRHLAPKVRVFVDFLVERFGANPYWDAK